jgi:hypothetical protein
MPNRTDDPPGTRPKIVTAPASRLASPPATSPASRAIEDHPLTEESFRAIFSSNQRGGRWEPADEIQVLAVCGEVTLDFTRAELPPGGMIGIDARAICGAVEIILPDGAEVELEAEPFLGSVEHQHVRRKGVGDAIRDWVTGERDDDRPAPPTSAEPPYFRIDGRAILGSIKVTGR